MTAFAAGKQVGRYKIIRLLGQGAMGEVYLAEDPQIQRQLAIKTLRLLDVREDEIEERKERLLREARTAGRLLHPNIVTLFDAGEEEGWLYLAFEYVAGSDLAARVQKGPPLSLGEALRVVRETSLGLDFAHRHGVVHRDIKPHNLMLDTEGRVKISDFGIAKLAGQTTELTVTGSVLGSPHYLSPEQIRGVPLDGRSDLFSLGVVLYELLSGQRPFQGDTIGTLVYQILHTEPTLEELRPEVPARLRQISARLLAKEPDDRFPTAGEVAAELAAAERELGTAALAAPAVTASAVAGAPPAAAGSRGTGAAGAVAAPPPSTVPPTASPPGSGAAAASGPAVPTVGGVTTAVPPPAASASTGASPTRGTAVAGGARRGLWIGLAAAAVAGVVLIGVAGLLVLRAHPRPVQRLVQWLRPAAPSAETTPEETGGVGAQVPAGDELAPAEASPAVGAPVGEAGVAPATPEEGRQGATGSTVAGRAPAEVEPSAPPLLSQARPPSAPPPAAVPGATAPRPLDATPSPPQPGDRRPPGPAVTAPSPSPALPAAAAPPASVAAVEGTLATGLDLSFRIAPDDAFVLLDGTVIGRAREWGPESGRTFTLPGPGRYVLTLRRPGMLDRSLAIEAAAGGPAVTPLAARMVPIPAAEVALGDLDRYRVRDAVAFRIVPGNARLLVDGTLVGPAARYSGGLRRGGWLELEPGVHRITLLAPGRRQVDLAVEVTAGAVERRQRIELVMPGE